jgi:hypothetical protein
VLHITSRRLLVAVAIAAWLLAATSALPFDGFAGTFVGNPD